MIEIIPQNHFEVNTYVLYDQTKECVLVDVCSQTERERATIVDFINHFDMSPEHIRKTVEHLAWKRQMQKVIDEMCKDKD